MIQNHYHLSLSYLTTFRKDIALIPRSSHWVLEGSRQSLFTPGSLDRRIADSCIISPMHSKLSALRSNHQSANMPIKVSTVNLNKTIKKDILHNELRNNELKNKHIVRVNCELRTEQVNNPSENVCKPAESRFIQPTCQYLKKSDTNTPFSSEQNRSTLNLKSLDWEGMLSPACGQLKLAFPFNEIGRRSIYGNNNKDKKSHLLSCASSKRTFIQCIIRLVRHREREVVAGREILDPRVIDIPDIWS
ncbi:unnamed protein product [Protopolystoma xenopodis]|uniref:Uncharacterized protein n=1 Tax=Protopolystoma xenopodis TaxID=117903 RepID=A0A3S5CJZ6_9PLAT|nr:unnamed protein product [Protopolystoma xenopodis]